ncbi:MAG: hypothetical protein IJZ89_05345 [Clostridia bacterium]|nr:hypothetical protein [Clostridia bacterium]
MKDSLSEIAKIISELSEKREYLIAAIDGRCASGKTTLASSLSEFFDCNVIHMDDFFLRPKQRTAERLNTPGGNIDHERFLDEVFLPLRERRAFSFRPFNCSKQDLGASVYVPLKKINIIEGSYSCHPRLWDHYDLRFFMSVTSEEQMHRIIRRNGGEKAEIFKNKWIPLEEKYFSEFKIEERCDYRF